MGTPVEGRFANIGDLVIAGWTGRDAGAVEAHIVELEALGVARPASVPCFYRVSAGLITTEEIFQVVGENTSGEVEFVLFSFDDGLWVGAGSDHTDRELESHSVALSKQACFKPVAPVLWRYEEVADHWDDLVLRAHILEGSQRVLYQEGPVSVMRSPDDLIGRYAGGKLPSGTALFGGTLAVRGSVRPSARFEFELEDPVLKRKITHGYTVQTLPIIE